MKWILINAYFVRRSLILLLTGDFHPCICLNSLEETFRTTLLFSRSYHSIRDLSASPFLCTLYNFWTIVYVCVGTIFLSRIAPCLSYGFLQVNIVRIKYWINTYQNMDHT